MVRRAAIVWLVVLVLTAIGVHRPLPDSLKYGVELLLLAPVLVMFASHSEVRATLARLSRGRRRFALVFLAMLVLGNVLKQHRALLPFMGWGMFGRSASRGPRMVIYTAVRPDGSSFRFMPGAVVSDTVASSIDRFSKETVTAILEARDPAERERASTKLSTALYRLARIHEDAGGRPAGPIERVQASNCLARMTPPYPWQCEPVGDYPVGRTR